MPSREFFEQIANDCGVFRYRNEELPSFYSRTAYTAAKHWTHAICLDDGVGGKVGITKQAINSRLKKWSRDICDVVPSLRGWFGEDFEDISAVYNELIDVNDLQESDFDEHFRVVPVNPVALPNGFEALVGFYDPTSASAPKRLITCGLLDIRSSGVASWVSAGHWWDRDADIIQWTSSKNYGELLYADPGRQRWSIRESDVWHDAPTWVDGLTLASADAPDGAERILLIVEKGRTSISVSPISWRQAEELFFYLRADVGRPAIAAYTRLDDKHIKIAAPNGYLPEYQNCLIDALTWPVSSIKDRLMRIARAESLPVIEGLLSDVCISIRETGKL